MGRLKRRARGLVAALAILASTVAAALVLLRLDRRRAAERLRDDAQAAGLRASDGVRTLMGTLEARVLNGTANPRLVAALDANVDEETLRDLLFNEPWWEPFRRSVDGFGLYTDETAAVVTSRLPAGFEARDLVHDARALRRAASGLVISAGQVMAASAAPVALTGRSDWPVLVATRTLDVGVLAGIAQRAGAAVAISDGHLLLVAAASGSVAAPDGLGAGPLQQALDLPAPGVGIYGGVAVAALPLADGLHILAGVSAPVTAAGGMPLPGAVLAVGLLLAIGLGLSLGSVFPLARRTTVENARSIEVTTAGAGSVIGRYTLIERIGLGGMAEIYSAVTAGEGSFRRPVVIKRLRPELSADPNAVAQFCDEANLLAALHHPNIVAVHDFGRWEDQYFLAEEYLQGRDLGRIVNKGFASGGRPPRPQVVAYVAREILKGLDYAHTVENERGRPMGIVQRDVSPENIMVSPRGGVKLLDFGVVKATEGRVTTKTEMGVVKGNVSYMSPEQARGLDVDARADLYSLALVMYFCCTGHPLYAAHTTYGLLMQAAAGPSSDGRSAIERLPPPISAVVQRATDPDLEKRYPNAREMAADLEAAARQGAAPAGALVAELFGPELKDESHRLASFPLGGSPSSLASASSR
jgi:serine/threonine-protein kinase